MITSTASFKKVAHCFLASKEFWFCFLAGWACFSYTNSLQAYYYGGSFYEAMVNTLEVGIFASLTLLTFRFYHIKHSWKKLHPLAFIPALCLLAMLFATFVSYFAFLVNTNISVERFSREVFINPGSTSLFGKIVGYFTTYFYVILIFLMVYVFIQAERNSVKIKQGRKHILLAVTSLLFVHELFHILSTIAYYNPPGYLFSFYYYWMFTFSTIFSLLLSVYIFFIKPREQLAGSHFLPQLPMFITLVFCSSVFSMWLFIITPHLYEMYTSVPFRYMLNFIGNVYSQNLPLWGGADAFAGLLHVKFDEQITAAIFLLYCNFSRVWQKDSLHNPKINFDIKRALQFWSYNLGGWSIAALYLYFSDLLDLEKAGKNIAQIFIFSFIVIGAFLSALLRSFMKRIQSTEASLISFTYKIVALSILFGTLQAFALTMTTYIYIYGVLGDAVLINTQHIFSGSYYFYKSLTWFSLCFILWSLIYDASISQRNKSLNTLKQLQLENNMRKVQLDTLAGKIDPHFIFNALNNIRSLIREDSEKARDAVLILSDILRSPIAKSSQEKVSIIEEMQLVRNYIALSKIQLETRLNYKEIINIELKTALIPSMMLQILVENAIKHGISQLPEGGVLILEINVEGQELICRVSNTGELANKSKAEGFGVGISNIQERISLLYADKARFILREDRDMVLAELKLPLEYKNNQGQ